MGLCKKKKSLSDEDFEKEYGRHWIWASIDPESKLIINSGAKPPAMLGRIEKAML